MDADASAVPQWTPCLARGCLGGGEQGATCSCPRRHLRTPKLGRRLDPQPMSTQATGARRAVPQPQRVEWLGPLAQARQPPPLATQPTLQAAGRTGLFLLQGFQGPVERPLILGCARGHVDPAPDLTRAVVLPHQHTQQLAHVSPLTRGPPLAPIALDRGGIHPLVGEPVCLQKRCRHKPARPAS
jgi:hypothetical protein